MTEYLRVSPRAIVIEQEIAGHPQRATHRFVTDPAPWLPGRLVMKGAVSFHTRMRLFGAMRELESTIGTPWTRGKSTTRRLAIEVLDPPYGLSWLLPMIEGELSLVRNRKRMLLRFEGAPVSRGLINMKVFSARRVMRSVLAGIARRLAAPEHPTQPSTTNGV